MNDNTIGNAVANRDNNAESLTRRYQGQFADVLPEHIQSKTFVGLAIGALRRNKELEKAANANKGSFLNALLDCARLGHEPGTESYYLVPFGNEVVGIEGYRGEIERIYRAGAVSSVIAEVVYSSDTWHMVPGQAETIAHEVDWDAEDRGELRLVYAYARMRDGAYSKPVVLNKAQIAKIKKEAKGAGRADSPWNKWPESMWLKSAVHQLEKWVPTSAEYRREQLRAAVEADNLRTPRQTVSHARDIPDERVDPDTGVIDAEIVEDADGQQGWPDVAQPGGQS